MVVDGLAGDSQDVGYLLVGQAFDTAQLKTLPGGVAASPRPTAG